MSLSVYLSRQYCSVLVAIGTHLINMCSQTVELNCTCAFVKYNSVLIVSGEGDANCHTQRMMWWEGDDATHKG